MEKLTAIFNSRPEIKLVYFFGSKASGSDGPLSDYDFAVFLSEKNKLKRFDIKFELMKELSRTLGTDAVDVAILNDTESPEFKYGVIKEGKLIFEREPYRVLIEPQILNEYFDFMQIIRRYGLTRA